MARGNRLCGFGIILLLQFFGTVPSSLAQDAIPTQKIEKSDELDPDSPLDPFPDIGVEWPSFEPEESEKPDAAAAEAEQSQSVDIKTDQNALLEEDEIERASIEKIAEGDLNYSTLLNGLGAEVNNSFYVRFRQLSALRAGRGKAANIAQINRRAKEDQLLIERLARIEGYYDVESDFDITAIEPNQKGEVANFAIQLSVNLGPQYRIGQIEIPGIEALKNDDQSVLSSATQLKIGDPVNADAITAGEANIRSEIAEIGFPFAKVEEAELLIDHADQSGDVTIAVESNGKYKFGAIKMADESLMDAQHVGLIAQFESGEIYRASAVEDLRRALIATGIVSTMSIVPEKTDDPDLVDINVGLEPAPLRTIAGAIGYGTGEGARIEASWEHRNFFPPEGMIRVRGVLGTQEQSAGIQFRRNNFRQRDQVLNAQLQFSNIDRDAFQARSYSFSANIERQTNLIFQKEWRWSFGVELLASDERDIVGGNIQSGRQSFLIGAAPFSLNYDGTDDLLDPTRGLRLGFRMSPEVSFQAGTFTYVRAQIDASAYQPLGDKVVVAGRARFGAIGGASNIRIAPSRRFYAGGGASVRGYGYQRVGPRDINNDPIGGRSLAEFSLEARVRVGNFGIVPFIDAGNIYSSELPRFTGMRVGAGIGVRYHTNFGPIRLDVGTPLNRQAGDSRIAVYISLGQAF